MNDSKNSKSFFSRPVVISTLVSLTALATFVVAYVLISVFKHKTESEKTYLRLVDVKQATTDPAHWGVNWPSEYDQYLRTSEASKTNFGGGDAQPNQKSQVFPFLTSMFQGYAFSLDYRDRRGHSFMLFDQEHTRRVTERPQTGACLHCHSSLVPTLVRLGGGDQNSSPYDEETIRKGFDKLSKMPYAEAHQEVENTGSLNPAAGKPENFAHAKGAHPVSCTDCHNAQTMKLEVNRPGFIAGIQALKASQGVPHFNVNRDATRAEMRTYVCAQCHVEYYCGPKVTLFFPWNDGIKVEQIEGFYNRYQFPDGHRFFDWKHGQTGAELLKAQHPEFEMWSQGIHARSGVSCADCHMPYSRQGALKVSDHYVRSPLLMVNHSCQQCHSWSENELKERVATIQNRTFATMMRAGQSFLDFNETFKQIRAPFDEKNRPEAERAAQAKLAQNADYAKMDTEAKAKKLSETTQAEMNELWAKQVQADPNLKEIAELHRKAQWRLDFVAAENSMGFHAPQEASRILGESIDYFRQAQIRTVQQLPAGTKVPVTEPTQVQNPPAQNQ